MPKRDVTEAEFSSLVTEVLERLATDPRAEHLWQWRSRPGCADEPIGTGRRRSLNRLLGMMGAAAVLPLATSAAACGKKAAPPVKTEPIQNTAPDAGPGEPIDQPCADDPCADPQPCADDPCACPDEPMPCADDPCSVP